MNFEKLPHHPESSPEQLTDNKSIEQPRDYQTESLRDDSHDLNILYSTEEGIGAGDYRNAFANLGVEMTEEEADAFATQTLPEKRKTAGYRLFGQEVNHNQKPLDRYHRVFKHLGNNDFEENPETGHRRLSPRVAENARFRIRRNQQFLEQIKNREGAFGEMSDEEIADLTARLQSEIEADQRIVTLAESREDYQDQFADIADEYDSLGDQDLSEEELDSAVLDLLTQVDDVYQGIVAEISQSQEQTDDQIDDEVVSDVTTEESSIIQTELKVGEDQVKGKTASGDIIVTIGDNISCAFDIHALEVEWIKIDINGKEFTRRAPEKSITPHNFRRELAMARLSAVCNYFDLPFDQLERDHLIEIYRANAEVGSGPFDYQDYDDALEFGLVDFLEALTPENGQTKEALETAGVIDKDGQFTLNGQDNLSQAICKWREFNGDPRKLQDFLGTLIV